MQVYKGKQVFENVHEIVNPAHAAVLCVDMQKELCDSDSYFGRRGLDTSMVHAIAEPIGRFLDQARAASVQVAYAQQSTPADGSGDSPAWLRFKTKAYGLKPTDQDDYMVVGTKGYEWMDEIEPKDGDVVVPKIHASAFIDTPMNLALRSLGIKSLVITGAASYGCLLTTVLDASCYDYYIVIAQDLVAGPNRELHEAAMKIMARRYDCVDSAEIVDSWRKYAQ